MDYQAKEYLDDRFDEINEKLDSIMEKIGVEDEEDDSGVEDEEDDSEVEDLE